jgi:hypothetical protein
VIDVDSYCRDLEAYLCRKNDGHLIRITGPAFERVQGWAHQGIPVTIAEAGIDRYFERYYRKGPRRRPVQILFCEADVLDAFDEWRRAVGIARDTSETEGGPASKARRSLASQIDSALARLTVMRGSDQAGPGLDAPLESAVRALDGLRPEAARARGDARDALLQRVAQIAETLTAAAFETLESNQRSAFEQEADAELAPFKTRMSADAFAQSRRAAIHRLVRQHFGLPSL